jgi:hypothetical protein
LGMNGFLRIPRQDVAGATRAYQLNPKSLKAFSWTPVRVASDLRT